MSVSAMSSRQVSGMCWNQTPSPDTITSTRTSLHSPPSMFTFGRITGRNRVRTLALPAAEPVTLATAS